MTSKPFIPRINEVNVFDQHCILSISGGEGIFEVDFRTYHFKAGRILFLSPGQYFQLLHGSLIIDWFEFSGSEIEQTTNARFLFKHLIGLGYIDRSKPNLAHFKAVPHLESKGTGLLQEAIDDWLLLNPFNASTCEVNLLFDLKEIIDQKYREPISSESISRQLGHDPYRIKSITRKKLQSTVKKLSRMKLLLEAQRKVVFTDFTTKEIAYDLGFNEPPYFNRFFKQLTGNTPHEFRSLHNFSDRETLSVDFNGLLENHFKEYHQVSYYADQLNMSIKTLNKRIKAKLGTSPSQLIRNRVLKESKLLIKEGLSVKDIAFELGFKESNHFSSSFKKYIGKTPSEYLTTTKKSIQ